MTYKETAPRSSADPIERLAIVLSKRLDRADLAASLFTEILSISAATHAVIWHKEAKPSSIFLADLASCRIEANESFDAADLGALAFWNDGNKVPFQLDNKDENISGTVWAKYNYLMPLYSSDNVLQGILSLHYSAEARRENIPYTPTIGQMIVNALIADKRATQESTVQLQNELWLEHNHRIILQRIIGRLDRDFILQSAVDTLGNILKGSSCLILRSDAAMSARITHEYVDPELSPLGLGWSSTIPQVIASQMCEKTTVLEETGIRKHESDQYVDGMESLFETSIRSVAGTPILLAGTSLGALVVQSNRERKWRREELKLLEATAHGLSLALRNADFYQEAKEQVFNLNLVSNLTRQLSTAVEQLYKSPARDAPQDEDGLSQAGKAPPLSARELEVLKLIASGLANREIAQRLFLTESTVELHASRIRKKLKLKSRTALVKFACDNHLV